MSIIKRAREWCERVYGDSSGSGRLYTGGAIVSAWQLLEYLESIESDEEATVGVREFAEKCWNILNRGAWDGTIDMFDNLQEFIKPYLNPHQPLVTSEILSKEAVSVDEVMEEAEKYCKKGYLETGMTNGLLTVSDTLYRHLQQFIASKRSKEAVEDKWIPVSERLPEMEGYYLVYVQERREYWDTETETKEKRVEVKKISEYNHIAHSHFSPGYGRFERSEWDYEKVTHWQPLPEPPINTAKESGEKE